MIRYVIFSMILLVTACDREIAQLPRLLFGHEVNQVVISKSPVNLSSEKRTFSSSEEMKVVGDMTSVCLSLKGDTPIQSSEVMNRAFSEAMHGAKVTVVLVMKNGERFQLDQPLMAWSLAGKIVDNNELAACASAPCNDRLPVGAQIDTVEVSSVPDLMVQGIYWESEQGPPEKPTSSTTALTETLKKAKNCRIVCRGQQARIQWPDNSAPEIMLSPYDAGRKLRNLVRDT